MPRSARLTGLDKYLASSEHVLYVCRRHWILVAKPIVLWLLLLAAGSLVGFMTSPDVGTDFIDWIAGFAVLAATIYAGWEIAHWWAARYVVSDRRVLLVEGIISRKVSAIPLAKVTDTTYRRSLFGRLLGYGDLMLDSPGEKPGLSVLTSLPRPDELYRLVMSLVIKKEEAIEEQQPISLPSPKPPSDDDTGPIEVVTVKREPAPD